MCIRDRADQGLDAGAQDFLDQFEAAAAGDNRQPASGRDLLADQSADQFVEGVVPADIFAAEQQLTFVIHEHRGMHRTAMLAQGLEGADALAQAIKPFDRWQRGAGQYLKVWQRLLDRFHTAQPATAGAGQLSTLLLEVPEGAVGDGHLRVLR